MNAEVRFDFEGKVAIVTGAARGVGRARVREFVPVPDAASYIRGAVSSVDGASGAGSRFSGVVVDEDTRYDWVTGRVRASRELSSREA